MLFLNDTATSVIYTLSLHDALPISGRMPTVRLNSDFEGLVALLESQGSKVKNIVREMLLAQMSSDVWTAVLQDRKSTRLNSSHPSISYAVFCLKKKKEHEAHPPLAY